MGTLATFQVSSRCWEAFCKCSASEYRANSASQLDPAECDRSFAMPLRLTSLGCGLCLLYLLPGSNVG